LVGNFHTSPLQYVEQAEGPQTASIDLFSMLAAVLRHWKLIIVISVFALITTYGALKLVPSLYKSTAEILIFDPTQQMDEAVQKSVSPFVDPVDNVSMNTEIEVIKSKSLALRVAKELRLDNDPEFQPHSRLSKLAELLRLPRLGWSNDTRQIGEGPKEASAGQLDRAADVLLGRLQADRVLFSYILSISVSSQDPVKAQRLAQTITEDYLASQREARQDAVQRVATWLKERVDNLQSRVLETEASIEKLKAENGIIDAGSSNVGEQQIAALTAQLMSVRGEVAAERAHLDQARRIIDGNGDIQAIPEFMASGIISRLRQEQEELTWREADLRTKLGEGHAAVTAVRAQLAGINKQMSAEADHVLGNMQDAYEIATQREQSLDASVQRLTASRSNSEVYLKLQQMRRVADADRKLYESYLSQFNEISQRRMLQDASARIIAPATLPSSSSSPRRTLFYVLAGIFGLGGGVLLAFLIEYLQTGVKTGAQVEQSFGYPVVGVIPFVQPRKFRRIARDRLINTMVDAPLSHFSESVRAMRIGLELSSSDKVPKVILITSALPAEGKSTTAMLLAASSATSGHRTVLVDCDLRQHAISEVFGKNEPGLSELLRGTAELADVTSKDPATNTDLIPAGSIVPNPADLLMSPRMRDLIAQLRDRYDYVVMDASPLLPVIDALALATMVDKILMIVEWNHTPRAIVSEAFKVLRPEAPRIAGIVLNKVDLKQLQGYGYRGGYHYRSFDKYFGNG
jgi:succinoglycan biosynthesis transport protein ExoP